MQQENLIDDGTRLIQLSSLFYDIDQNLFVDARFVRINMI